MSIHHHPHEASLMAYVAGTASPQVSFVVAAHLCFCAECRKKVQELEAVGGVLLDELPEVQMSTGALDEMMAMLDTESPKTLAVQAKPPILQNNIPAPLLELFPNGYDQVSWKSVVPGIKSHTFSGIDLEAGTLRLLQIAPGMTLPEHSHTGTELTLVLQGSFSDEMGRFKAGDLADIDDDVHHQPIADTGEPCICLIATEGPLKFKSFVPRMLQPFIGM